MAVLSNPEVAEVLAPNINAVSSLLSNPSCGMISQIKIEYNVIEVLPDGMCFHICSKKFVKHDFFKKGYTPRAFVPYTFSEDRVPYPLPFVQGN